MGDLQTGKISRKCKRGKTCEVYAPVVKPKKEGIDRYEPKATDSEEVAEWRQRMGTPEAKEIYKERAATAECVNAQARNRGLQQFTVRGLKKVKAIATWFAIAHNMARSFALQPQPVVNDLFLTSPTMQLPDFFTGSELPVSNCVFTVQLDKKHFPCLAVEVRPVGLKLLFDVLG